MDNLHDFGQCHPLNLVDVPVNNLNRLSEFKLLRQDSLEFYLVFFALCRNALLHLSDEQLTIEHFVLDLRIEHSNSFLDLLALSLQISVLLLLLSCAVALNFAIQVLQGVHLIQGLLQLHFQMLYLNFVFSDARDVVGLDELLKIGN